MSLFISQLHALNKLNTIFRCFSTLFQQQQQQHQQHQQQQHQQHQQQQHQQQHTHQKHQKHHQQEQLNNQQSFLPHPTIEDMKREALEARLESESPYMDQIDLSLAAAAAAAAAAHHHHNSIGGGPGGNMHHPNSRHHDIENSLHKEFTPSSPMSLPAHFNPREGPQHPPSPLQFPGMSSALTLTPPHHSKFYSLICLLLLLALLYPVNQVRQ